MIPAADEVEALVLRQLGGIGAVRREVPRGRRPGAAAAEAPAGRPQPAVAAAQARRRSARGRGALRLVPDAARGLPRVPARRLRHARAGRHAAADRDARDQGRDASTRPSRRRSPSSLLFGYVANFIYDGDAPLAERRAQALAIDQNQLRELLGEAELRELLDHDALDAGRSAAAAPRRDAPGAEHRRRSRSPAAARRSDRRRARGAQPHRWRSRRIAELVRARRAVAVQHRRRAALHPRRGRRPLSRRARRAAAARPARVAAAAFGERRRSTSRGAMHARTGRSRPTTSPRRYGLGRATARRAAQGAGGRRAACSKASSGPAGRGREWCDAEVLQSIRRRSLAKLRKEVEPVDPPVLGRLITSWQGVVRRRAGTRRAARHDREPAGRAAAGIDLRERDPRGAHRGLQPRRPRRADRRRRNRLVRRRAAGRAGRPHRALPDRSLRPPAARATGRPTFRRASRQIVAHLPRTARRSSAICTRRPAAATRARPSTRCGTWCGRA